MSTGSAGPADGSAGWRRDTIGSRHLNLGQAVLDELRTAIIGGLYPQGARLVEEEIAARFDVSRNPIRDALRTLSTEGFVVIEPRRGARVATVDARNARDLFEVRRPLEGLVAGLAALRATPADVDALRDVVRRGAAAVEAGRLETLPALNTEFHGALAVAADNQLLAAMLGRLSDIIRWIYASRIRERSHQSWAEHADIVEAIAAGDATTAERLGIEHITRALGAYETAADRSAAAEEAAPT
ncbi:GntR family transcriptional regulator [Desertimonas flava]|uniref:GntR family transcriptional regulator n=1 Tax=Desertimonas flava TaxID=2064846 RepID=UPI000E34D272|nr:GntR family transcriptional regulator [Desertimonas flava]